MGSSVRKNDSSGISGIFGGNTQTMQRNAQNILGNPYEESPAYKKLQNQNWNEPPSQEVIDQSLDLKIDQKLEEIDKMLARNPQPVQTDYKAVSDFKQVSVNQNSQIQQQQRGQYRVRAPFMTDPSLDPVEELQIVQEEQKEPIPVQQQQEQVQWDEEQEISQPKKKEERKEEQILKRKPPTQQSNKSKIQEAQNQAKAKRLNSVQKKKEESKTSMTGLPIQKKNSLLAKKVGPAQRQQTLKERQQNRDLEELGSEFQTQEEEIKPQQKPPQITKPPIQQKANLSSQQQQKDDDLDQSYQLQVQIAALERQLNTRTTENQKMKKKIQKLEKQIEDMQKESEKAPNVFKEAQQKQQPTGNMDERRMMLLKAQNTQLTRQITSLNRILNQTRETTIELDALLDQLMSFQVSRDPEVVKQRIPKIADQAKQMRQRLQIQLNSDRKQFNKQHLEANPLSEINEDEDGLRFDREKVFEAEEKLSVLLKDCLTLCLNTFNKGKMPKLEQLQGFCQDLRESIESLLYMGIGLEPSTERNQSTRQLKSFIQKKFEDKLELKTYILESKKQEENTQIFTKTLETKLINLVLPKNEQKLRTILQSLSQQELSYWTELYLKDLELRVHRKISQKSEQNALQSRNWLKRQVSSIFSSAALSSLIEAFRDLENCQGSEVRLEAVFNQHKEFIGRALEDIQEFLEIKGGEKVEEELLREFEQYVKEIN